MNKRLKQISLTLMLMIIIGIIIPTNVSAQGVYSRTVEYIGDGIICETIIEETPTINAPDLGRSSSTKTKSGSKTVTYQNGAGQTLWSVKVTGNFKYNGTTSSCTSSTVTATSSNSTWKISNKSSSYSGNTAKATATGKQYSGKTVIFTLTKTVGISCSKNGTLS
jgi:hypothetical protein